MLNFRTKHHPGQRGSERKDLEHPAWVDLGDGSPPRNCMVMDVSQTGARIAIDNPSEVPDEFTLFLTGGGTVRRKCRVARRNNGEIGVRFVSATAPAR